MKVDVCSPAGRATGGDLFFPKKYRYKQYNVFLVSCRCRFPIFSSLVREKNSADPECTRTLAIRPYSDGITRCLRWLRKMLRGEI